MLFIINDNIPKTYDNVIIIHDNISKTYDNVQITLARRMAVSRRNSDSNCFKPRTTIVPYLLTDHDVSWTCTDVAAATIRADWRATAENQSFVRIKVLKRNYTFWWYFLVLGGNQNPGPLSINTPLFEEPLKRTYMLTVYVRLKNNIIITGHLILSLLKFSTYPCKPTPGQEKVF